MNAFTIKDLENLTGIKAHTIRIWEQRYNFLKPNRTQTNIRYYSNDELKLFLNISLLHKNGFKISHLDKMGSEEMNSRILSIQPDNSSESAIAKLIEHTIELLPDEFEALIDAQIKRMGIEATIIQVVFPFFERISLLWATSHICPAHEHMVSNIIRQKLVVGIEKVTASVKKEYTVLLFLPEYEFHELGLLYTHFLMKSWGIHILYLGANVPVSDVVFVAKEKKPDLLMMHLTSLPGQYNIDKYFSTLAKSVQPVPILVSGLFVKTYKKPLPKNINFKYSLHEVLEFIKGV